MRVVTIAVPKGRVLKALIPVFTRLGVDPAVILGGDRSLMREIPELGYRFLLLKPDDVPTYVEYGAADLGVCGRDVLLERGFDLYQPVDLGIGRCQMVVATPEHVAMSDLPDPPRIASKYPRIAAAHFAKRGVQAEVVYVQGSVELAPLTGLADAIVDLVETGETLKQNHLAVREVVAEISSVLVANRAAFKLLGARARQVVDAFASTDSAASIARV